MLTCLNSNLVTLLLDLANQFRNAFCDPAKHEESRLGLMLVKQVKHAFRAGIDSQLTAIPILSLNHVAEIVDTKPILQVNGHGVFHRRFCTQILLLLYHGWASRPALARMGSQRTYRSPLRNL